MYMMTNKVRGQELYMTNTYGYMWKHAGQGDY